MTKSTTYATNLLGHVLNSAALTLPGTLHLSLHTANPGTGGAQTTSEAAYASYARVALTRGGGAWTVTAGVATLAAETAFPDATAAGTTITHFAIGTESSGTGLVLYSGAVSPTIPVADGTRPILRDTSTITEE